MVVKKTTTTSGKNRIRGNNRRTAPAKVIVIPSNTTRLTEAIEDES